MEDQRRITHIVLLRQPLHAKFRPRASVSARGLGRRQVIHVVLDMM